MLINRRGPTSATANSTTTYATTAAGAAAVTTAVAVAATDIAYVTSGKCSADRLLMLCLRPRLDRSDTQAAVRPLGHCSWRCMAKSPCCICNVCISVSLFVTTSELVPL